MNDSTESQQPNDGTASETGTAPGPTTGEHAADAHLVPGAQPQPQAHLVPGSAAP